MGNTIGSDPLTPDYKCVHMSNGLTDVFFNVLVLSGSALAQSVEQKQLIVWLAEHDQSRVGRGTVGFDLCDMPWDPATFAEDKGFLIQAISAAKERLGWEKLDYQPNEDILFPCLDLFAELLSGMDASKIQPEALKEWLAAAEPDDPVLCGFPRCSKHQILFTVFGCHICNDQGVGRFGRAAGICHLAL